jgi:hypothetical protein
MDRPKGMHERTFRRLRQDFIDAIDREQGAFGIVVLRFADSSSNECVIGLRIASTRTRLDNSDLHDLWRARQGIRWNLWPRLKSRSAAELIGFNAWKDKRELPSKRDASCDKNRQLER